MTEIIVDIVPSLIKISKQPVETRGYPLCFTKVLKQGESISSAEVCYTGNSVEKELTVAGSVVTVILSGGTHGDIIPMRVVADGSAGSVCSQCLLLTITDPLEYLAEGKAPEYDDGTTIKYDDGSPV